VSDRRLGRLFVFVLTLIAVTAFTLLVLGIPHTAPAPAPTLGQLVTK
jgi:hypothetical protein